MTHLSGTAIKIGKYAIQRCMLCGYALIDDDLSRQMAPVEDRRSEPAFFNTGSWVHVSSDGPCTGLSMTGELPERFGERDIPEDVCRDLSDAFE